MGIYVAADPTLLANPVLEQDKWVVGTSLSRLSLLPSFSWPASLSQAISQRWVW